MEYDPLTLHNECNRLLRRNSKKQICEYVRHTLHNNSQNCDKKKTDTLRTHTPFNFFDCILLMMCIPTKVHEDVQISNLSFLKPA